MDPTPAADPGRAPSEAPTVPVPVPVAIVGAGPVGLALALGLARHGVASTVLERKNGTSRQSKAPALHARTREIFRQWGVDQVLADAGIAIDTLRIRAAGSGRTMLAVDFSELEAETDRPGLLLLEQSRIEQALLDAVRASGSCDVRFDTEVVGLDQDDSSGPGPGGGRDEGAGGGGGVTLTVRRNGVEEQLTAAFVVGCDGADSFVRPAIGLDFAGLTYAIRPMLADVSIDDDRDARPWPSVHNSRRGITAGIRLRPGLWRIIRLEAADPSRPEDVPTEEVRLRTAEVIGQGPVEVVWASRFRIHRRAAQRGRAGRVLLAGDAAHVQPPTGGQGMNAGIQDAHNLAWKLATALDGGDVEPLLDSYDVERRAVVGSISRFTDALTRIFLLTPTPIRRLAFALLQPLLRPAGARRRALRRGMMLDLDYPSSPLLEPGDRAAGRRLPDPPLDAPDGSTVRLHSLLPNAPALLRVATTPGAEDEDEDGGAVATVIRIGHGGHRDPTGALQRLLGGGDGWILIRPDRHIAWARPHLGDADAIDHALGRQRGPG